MSSGNTGNRCNWGEINWDRKEWGRPGRRSFDGKERGVYKDYGGGHNYDNGFRGGRQNDNGARGYELWNEIPRESSRKRVSEEIGGANEYISDHESILGVKKSRYSVFPASKINWSGQVEEFTKQRPPEPNIEDVGEDEDLQLNKYNVEMRHADIWVNEIEEEEEVNVRGMFKEQHTKIHTAVKNAFTENIVGEEPKGKPDGSIQGDGSAEAEPLPRNVIRRAGCIQGPFSFTNTNERGGGPAIAALPSSSGVRAMTSTPTATNTHSRGGGTAKAPLPHTNKGKSSVGRGKTGKPAASEPTPSTIPTGLVLPFDSAGSSQTRDYVNEAANVETVSHNPATETKASDTLAELDDRWTVETLGKGKARTGKKGVPGPAKVRPPEPALDRSGVKRKRRSKLQRERDMLKRSATSNAASAPVQPAPGTSSVARNIAGEGSNPNATASAKRARFDDSLSPQKQSKKQRLESKREPRSSFADAVIADLMVAVTTEVTGHLSTQQAQEVQEILQARLMQDAMQLSTDPATPPPRFRGKPVHTNGALKLWCEDRATLSWLTLSLGTMSLATGEKLMVKKQCELPRRLRCGILLPGVWTDMRTVGRVLRYQNPWAMVNRWLLHKADVQQAETFAIVSIPEDVVKPLVTRGRRLGFLLGSVYAKFQGPKGKFYENPPTPQDEQRPDKVKEDADEAVGETVTAISNSPLQGEQTNPDTDAAEACSLAESEDGGEDQEVLLSDDDGFPFPNM